MAVVDVGDWISIASIVSIISIIVIIVSMNIVIIIIIVINIICHHSINSLKCSLQGVDGNKSKTIDRAEFANLFQDGSAQAKAAFSQPIYALAD